jgi:hypothetical protein
LACWRWRSTKEADFSLAAHERDRQRKRPTDLDGSLEKISTRVLSDGVVVVDAPWLRVRLAVLLVVGACGRVRCSSP